MKRVKMLLEPRQILANAAAMAALTLLGSVLANAQPAPDQKNLPAEQVFKNVQVLKGIPVDEFMATMGFFSASLGETCTDCHIAESGGDWAKYADDNASKRTTRRMIQMMNGINKTYFGGARMITCYSCHRGTDRPRVTPSLVELYGPPAPAEEPDQLRPAAPKAPTADKILDKYIEALGGAQKLAALTSFTAKGTYAGFAATDMTPVDIYAKAPAQRSVVVHTPNGDATTTYDGTMGWLAAPATDRPVPLTEYHDGDLDGVRLDAQLDFPAQIKQTLRNWRVLGTSMIDGREVRLVQGTVDGRHPVNLYFDTKTGLLARLVRYTDSPVGLNPTQIDYSDYRPVAGVQMPFKRSETWLDGQAVTLLSEIQPNAPVDAAKFAQPAAPK